MSTTHAPLIPVYKLKIPCPVCGKLDNCSATSDRSRVYCRRISSPYPGADGGYLHVISESTPQPQSPKAASAPSLSPLTALANPATRAAVYNALLDHLVLSREHRDNLRARGLSDEAIDLYQFRSAPTTLFATSIARQLSRDFDFSGVPGFYVKGATPLLAFGFWNQGIVTPVRDEEGRIAALSVRLDAPMRSNKYRWLSSKEFPQGASPGVPAHFARPLEEITDPAEIIVTEGAIKACVISMFTQARVCGLASVTTFSADIGRDFCQKFPRLERAVVAFDADFRSNRQVHRRTIQLTRALKFAGLKVIVRTWPAQLGKGYDDFLLYESLQRGDHASA